MIRTKESMKFLMRTSEYKYSLESKEILNTIRNCSVKTGEGYTILEGPICEIDQFKRSIRKVGA